jgi:uncharacterized membrane protein YhaH (DUF805 family)
MYWYIEVLKKYAVFKGRASRKEFWMFYLVSFIILFIIGIVEKVFSELAITFVYELTVFIPSLAVGVRRLHDINRRGWWIIVPIVGYVFMIFKGQEGKNRFGVDPQKK